MPLVQGADGKKIGGTMNTLITQALQAVWNIWGIANFWVRLAITVIVVSPVMVAMASLTGSLTLTAITALFPVLALAWVFLFQVDPLIIPLLQRTPGIRGTFNAGIKLFKKIVAVEILMGGYIFPSFRSTTVPASLPPYSS